MVRREGRVGPLEMELRGAHGNALNVLLSAMGMFDERGVMTGLRGQLYDISAHKRVELQFSQSQKMEAIGRLAGGIAHDFNNLLTIIGGQAERLIEGLKPGDPLRRSADAVAQAAERASGLTQQLLAFSRRQVMAPRLISINDLVKNVHGMLERVIGEDINCEVSLSTAVGAVKVDPSRLEQALLNLAVNARDAMPTGGTLSIATANAVLDEAYGRDHLGAKPGHYVCLSVSDNGCGMDPATRARVFEPFFTTKEVGKGTGLGLSMVYGIVKQSGGYIWVYSEAGVGTSFKIYLPVADTIDAAAVQHDVAPAEVKASPARGSETVLLVEDEEDLRELLEEVLSQQGYRVYAASGGTSALQISEFMDEDIDLMITDVVMPQMSGRELSLKLQSRRPNVRILFLSGYTDDAISHHGVLEPGSAFLQKPFATAELARKVREVLESPSTN
jgi:signal transduction histidine kinase/CheY-like chemotaxis protein